MSKRFRFIIILGVLALCFVFLLPSIRWYIWTPRQDQARALATREQIRAYATGMAHTHFENLNSLARADAMLDMLASIIRAGGNIPAEIQEHLNAIVRTGRPMPAWGQQMLVSRINAGGPVPEGVLNQFAALVREGSDAPEPVVNRLVYLARTGTADQELGALNAQAREGFITAQAELALDLLVSIINSGGNVSPELQEHLAAAVLGSWEVPFWGFTEPFRDTLVSLVNAGGAVSEEALYELSVILSSGGHIPEDVLNRLISLARPGVPTGELDGLLAQARGELVVPERLDFLTAEARRLHRTARLPAPERWSPAAVSRTFSRQEVLTAIETHYREEIFALRALHQNAVQLGLDLSGGLSIVLQADLDALRERLGHDLTDADREDAIERALDVLNSRIDRFGLTEPVIRRQGPDQIYVEIPGTADPERINDIIMGRGSLTFHIMDVAATNQFNMFYNANPAGTFDVRGELVNPAMIPDHLVVRGVFERDEFGLDIQRRNAAGNPDFVLINREIGLDGNHIRSADVRQSADVMERNPVVIFNLDSEGGDIFHRLTSANVGVPLVIVLEDRVRSIATIQQPIWDNVSLTGFGAEEARNIALMLRTAALPVELEVVNQQSIGASLGEDTIRRGLNALLLGITLVLVFMLLYYKAAGINAVVAQVMNFYIMFSILSAFNFTLTLPAIAGFILTIGMATDASVIIFERMKEELRLGKSRKAAIEMGFDKAFWAIMDSNITTFIAALFLSQLGTGPIRGFAVALAIGVFSSVFTALFVSRLMFDFGTDVLRSKNLSLSWFPIRSETQALKGIS